MFKDSTVAEIEKNMQEAWLAFHEYRKKSLKQRAEFMRQIAEEIEQLGDKLIHTAMQETNLPEARLRGEKARTIFQLNSYASFCESGQWLDARIDTAIPDKTPPKPDIRKMLVPLGPVVVFGASNFPFAYSTAGGDTASAFAAGCSVIVKAHPAHPKTSDLVVTMATNIIMISGILASLVKSPTRISSPQTISKPPTKLPRNSGEGKPIFSNRPALSVSANKNF